MRGVLFLCPPYLTDIFIVVTLLYLSWIFIAMFSERSQSTLISIHALRSLAAICIVVAHIYPNYLAFGGDKNALPNFIFGACGVDIFFVISGFIMLYTSEKLFQQRGAMKTFLLKRLTRIAPLYWLATTAIILPAIIIHNSTLDWHSVLASYSFIPYFRGAELTNTAPILGVGWTLEHEVFFYICFSFTLFFSRNMAALIITIIMIFLIQFGHLFTHFFPTKFAFAVWINPLNYEFIYGIWIGVLFRNGLKINVWLSAVLILLAICCMIASFAYDFAIAPRHISWGLSAAMIVSATTLSKFNPSDNILRKAFLLLGNASYSLYLFHAVLPHYLHVVMLRIFNPVEYPNCYAFFLFCLSLIGAIMLHLVIEKPMTKRIQKWFIKAKPLATSTLDIPDQIELIERFGKKSSIT